MMMFGSAVINKHVERKFRNVTQLLSYERLDENGNLIHGASIVVYVVH